MSTALFAESVRKIVCNECDVAALFTAVDALRAEGQPALVFELYQIWLRHNPDDPLRTAVLFNYGTALIEAKDFNGAKAALEAAIQASPGFVPPYINLGNVCERLGRQDEALQRWMQAVTALGQINREGITYKLTALKQIGRLFSQNRKDAAAEDTFRQSLEIDPHQHDVCQHWVAVRQLQCKWPVIQPWGPLRYADIVKTLSPLSAAALVDDPIYQLANAAHYSRTDAEPGAVHARTPSASTAAPSGPRRLRIGYVSSDLRDHAVGYLMSELFELHDRARVEVFAYFCGVPYEDATKSRIRSSVEHWVDISAMTDEAAAAQIERDGIDILIDVNGYTKDGRLKLFAMQPAPIIVNWLGYPGTTGSRFHHYIVADDRIIPPELEKFYSEKVLRLPCYQPSDRKRVVSAKRPTRAEAGLPETAVVYCCFNGSQKFTPAMFSRWMDILARVPHGVLWLLASSDETHERLCQVADEKGIDRSRLIFAGRQPNGDHLARYPLADLFLDTWPYGAHTTASDALWMGVPVVTIAGRGFASRVCGSLVAAAGLPELVCTTPEAYVDLAVTLGHDTARRDYLRQRLAQGRDTCVLFDVPGLVRSLEALYEEMQADRLAGRLPTPDLSNLEVLHQIASEEGILEFGAIEVDRPYEQIYRAALLRRHAMTTARTDPRLSAPQDDESSDPAVLAERLRATAAELAGAARQSARRFA